MGAGASHPVQERHSRHRECRRRTRQGHRPALHFCVLAVELGARQRLHRAAGRDRRPEGRVPHGEGGEVLMQVKRFSEAKPYEAPNHRQYSSLRLFGAEAGGTQTLIAGVSHFLPGGGAGPDASPPEKVYFVLAGELIVTGASGAFGALAAKVLAGAGANVVLCASKADELSKVAAECEKLGGKTEIVAVRPSSEANCDEIVEAAVKKFGRVDILVVASGQNKVSKIVDQKPEDFLDVMDANVTQSWLIARAAGRQMLKQGRGGKVILMSSARGLLGHPASYTAYCASKAAVDGITKALGCEWGDTGITVNALGPTVFRSPLTQWMFEDSDRSREVRKGFLSRVPKGRLGEPSDLAGPLLFLASKASDFYTGHILYADGGYTAG